MNPPSIISTALTQIAAETLGIEMEKINTIFGDTETCPMGCGSRASRNGILIAYQEARGGSRLYSTGSR